MALPKAYGIRRGWPVGPGQYVPPGTPDAITILTNTTVLTNATVLRG